jgi:hypothetical protein
MSHGQSPYTIPPVEHQEHDGSANREYLDAIHEHPEQHVTDKAKAYHRVPISAVTVDVTGNGSVKVQPLNINAYRLTAVADEGYVFDSWDGSLEGDDNPVTLTMDGDKEVVAVFVVDE